MYTKQNIHLTTKMYCLLCVINKIDKDLLPTELVSPVIYVCMRVCVCHSQYISCFHGWKWL